MSRLPQPSFAILVLGVLFLSSGCDGLLSNATPEPSTANPEPSVELCESNDQCTNNTFCIAGVCAEGECEGKAECGASLICVERLCVVPPENCAGPNDCAGEMLCDGFSRTCFDPSATGCQTDNQCQLEPGCAGGCYCDENGACAPGTAPEPGVSPEPSVGPEPIGPTGESLELGGYRIEARNGSTVYTIVIPSEVVLEPGGVYVVGRKRDLNAFEGVWGPLPDGAWYSNGVVDGDNSSTGFPIVNGNYTYFVMSPSGTEIDATFEGDSKKQFARISTADGTNPSSWRISDDNDYSAASPGTAPDLPLTGVGLVISEWSDYDDFEDEFIELYYAP